MQSVEFSIIEYYRPSRSSQIGRRFPSLHGTASGRVYLLVQPAGSHRPDGIMVASIQYFHRQQDMQGSEVSKPIYSWSTVHRK